MADGLGQHHQLLGQAVFLPQAQAVEVQPGIGGLGLVQQVQRRFERVDQVGADRGRPRHLAGPALRAVARGGVEPPVQYRVQRGQPRGGGIGLFAAAALHEAQQPLLLEARRLPRHPGRRIELGRRLHQVQPVEQRQRLQRAVARVHQRQSQRLGPGPAHGQRIVDVDGEELRGAHWVPPCFALRCDPWPERAGRGRWAHFRAASLRSSPEAARRANAASVARSTPAGRPGRLPNVQSARRRCGCGSTRNSRRRPNNA
jgi:hypothetical protein